MNFNLIRSSTLALSVLATAGAFAQSTERKAFVLPHVLEATGSVCAPRDAATGQATGRRSVDMHLQIDEKTRAACDNAASSKHTKSGHVSLLK